MHMVEPALRDCLDDILAQHLRDARKQTRPRSVEPASPDRVVIPELLAQILQENLARRIILLLPDDLVTRSLVIGPDPFPLGVSAPPAHDGVIHRCAETPQPLEDIRSVPDCECTWFLGVR